MRHDEARVRCRRVEQTLHAQGAKTLCCCALLDKVGCRERGAGRCVCLPPAAPADSDVTVETERTRSDAPSLLLGRRT